MKNVFGILLIVVGVIMMIGGASAITDVSSRNDSFEGQFGNTFSQDYRSNNNEQQILGFGLAGVGFILLIVGIIMTASKSKVDGGSSNNSKLVDDLSSQSMTFYKNKDYLSTIAVLKRIVEIDPRNNKTHFNLTCCYSLTENIEAINSLAKAVECGYTNFERIKNYEALTWLRKQKEYEEFLKNGYKLNEIVTDKNTASKSKTLSNDDVMTQIEKLGKLKEQGFLTDEEFQEQKKKILG